MSFEGLPRGHFRAILADPPWHYETWSNVNTGEGVVPYATMTEAEILAMPVAELAAENCVLFLWNTWPTLLQGLSTITAWGFEYKTCAFCWTKANGRQLEMFEEHQTYVGLGHWTRANTEVCLLATRGGPRRLDLGVRQAIIEPRREHSRKPDCVYERIERLVAGPYLELFARTTRPGWTSWGDEVDKFAPVKDYDANDDMRQSIEDCYAAVRERKAAGGPGWPQEETFADRVIREGNALARKLKHSR